MSRNLIYAIVAVAVLLVGYFVFFAGGAGDVAETAGEAADAVAGATTEAATTAAGAATDAASAAATSVTEMLSGAGLGDLSQSLSGLNLDGFDASLLDPAKFNLDGLMTALGSAGLSGEAATGLRDVLTRVADTPEMLAEVLNQIKSALGL